MGECHDELPHFKAYHYAARENPHRLFCRHQLGEWPTKWQMRFSVMTVKHIGINYLIFSGGISDSERCSFITHTSRTRDIH